MVDPTKIKDIFYWARSTLIIEIWSFVGLAGYYKQFVEGFSLIATPLTQLNRLDVPFEWSSQYESSFRKLKDLLTIAPVMTLLVEGESFTVYFDASSIGLCCVLLQQSE